MLQVCSYYTAILLGIQWCCVSIPNATGLFLLSDMLIDGVKLSMFQYLMLQVCSYYSVLQGEKLEKVVSIPNATGLFLLWKGTIELEKTEKFQYLMLQVCSYYLTPKYDGCSIVWFQYLMLQVCSYYNQKLQYCWEYNGFNT